MKKNLLIYVYVIGLILGTVLINTQFDMTAFISGVPMAWSLPVYGMLVLKRGLGLILCYWFIYILPEKIRMPALACLAGCIIGVTVSIRAYSGYFFGCLLYGMIVCVMVMVYMGLIRWILVDGSEKCGIREPQGRKNLVKRLVIITIVLINCIFELKILKFF